VLAGAGAVAVAAAAVGIALAVGGGSGTRPTAPSVHVLASTATLAEIPAAGGAPRAVGPRTPFVFISSPSPSPDGRSLVFAGQRCAQCPSFLIVAPMTGGPARRLIAGAGEPDWGPGRRGIAFIHSRENASTGLRVRTIAPTGGPSREVEVVLEGEEGEEVGGEVPIFHNPAFSPDGRLLALDTETEPREIEQVVVVDLATGEAHAVTGERSSAAEPAFTPDGRAVVYACEGASGLNDLCTAPVSGRGRVASFGTPGDDRDPAVSPDGRSIVFASDVADRREGVRSLYAIGVDGRGLRRLTSGFDAAQPAFTPDGRHIVFVRREVVAQPADGSSPPAS